MKYTQIGSLRKRKEKRRKTICVDRESEWLSWWEADGGGDADLAKELQGIIG